VAAERGIRATLDSALVAPVRTGTFDLRRHSASAAGVAFAAAGLFALLLAAVVLATPLRSLGPLTGVDSGAGSGPIALPGALIPITLALIGCCLALVVTGALRGHLAIASGAVILAALVLAVILAAGGGTAPLSGPPLGGYAAVIGLVVIAALLRRWRGSVLRDLLAVLIPTLLALVLAERAFRAGATTSGVRVDVVAVAVVLTFLATLAIPVALNSGLAAVDVGVGLVIGVLTGLLTRTSRALTWLIGTASVVGMLWWNLREPWPGSRLLAVACGAVSLAAVALVWSLTRARSVADPAAVREATGRIGLPACYVLAAPVIIGGVLGMAGVVLAATATPGGRIVVPLRDFLLTGPGPALGRIAVIAGLLWIALRAGSRGRGGAGRHVAAAAGITAVIATAVALDTARWPWWSWSPAGTAVALLIAVLTWAAIRWHRGNPLSPATLIVVLGLTALLHQADALALPVALLLQGSATAVLVVGLAWGMLTDGGAAHRRTRLLSRDAALLLILGNLLFTATILMWASVGRQPLIASELQAATSLGVAIFGTSLVLHLCASLLSRPPS